ncbi:hypothetical protein ACB098_08G179100 [Castanea mollissima]
MSSWHHWPYSWDNQDQEPGEQYWLIEGETYRRRPQEISDAVPMAEVAGGRSFQNTDHFLWKFGNTPPKN